MSRAPRGAALGLLALAVLAVATRGAHAHALLERSDPAAGTVLAADHPPRRISLRFTEPVTVAPSAVTIVDGSNTRVAGPEARVAADDPSRVDVECPALAPGAYLVRWRVTSTDNHVVRGAFWFVVGFAATPPPAAALLGTGAPAVPVLEAVARWLGLLAMLGLAGAPLFELLVVAPGTLARSRAAPLVMTGIFVVAQIAWAAAQAAAVTEAPVLQSLDGPTLRTVLFASRFAALWWARLLLAFVLGGLLAWQAQREHRARRALITWCAALMGAALLACTALAGHAVGGRGAFPAAVTVAVDTVHLAAAALWLGGLVHLGLWLGRVRPSGSDDRPAARLAALVPRVSRAALASVTLLVVTGALNTYTQVGSLAILLRTAYGQSLLLKLVLLLPLLGIAALNLLVLRPRIAAGRASAEAWLLRLFRRLVWTEVVLGTAVLLAVGLLTTLPPPGQRTLPSNVEVARGAGSLRVALTVAPNWVGVSRFRVALADAQGRPPADVRRVILTFAMEGMNMGRSHVTLAPDGEGAYATEGFYVGMPGIAQLNVGVARSGGPDESAAFRIEVPDVNAAQLAGLARVLGIAGGDPDTRRTPADAASLARGRAAYEAQCAACHGDRGRGDGPAAASLLPPPADLTLHTRWHADEQLFWFIARGVPGTSMLGFASRLGARERWDVVSYLHALASAPSATAARPAPVAEIRPAPPPVPAAPTPDVMPAPTRSAPARSVPAAAPVVALLDAAAPACPTIADRLVFGPDFDNNLWLLRLPDTTPTPLTRLGPLEFSSNPAWSPDGKHLVFSYYRLPGGDAIPVPDGSDLYVMNADGGGLRPLAVHDVPGAALQYPAWAPDGSAVYVSYVRQGGGALAIDRVDVRSGARTRVVPNAGFPSLSRDGRRLAYVQSAVAPARGQSLWWSAPDGSHTQPVVAASVFDKLFGVRLAPDGKRLLFAAVGQPTASPPTLGFLRPLLGPAPAHANGDLWDLWIVDVDGRNLHPVTALSEDLPIAAWSPDGGSIAFLGGGSARSGEAGLTLIGADGAGLRRLTSQPGHRGVDWAPTLAPVARAR